MMSASTKALLELVDRQQRHTQSVLDRLVDPPRTSTSSAFSAAVQVRLQALDFAVKARGEAMSDDALVKTAKAFEDFLLGRTGGDT